MKTSLSKTQAREKIEEFFKQEEFEPKEVKKIKRLAMKFRISLKDKRKEFCKKCYSKLKGKIRVNKIHKSVECKSCNYLNKFLIKNSR